MDGEEPKFVILSYEQYQKIEADGEVILQTRRNGFVEANGMANLPAQGGKDASGEEEDEQKTVDRLNREILSLKEEIRQKEEAELIESEQPAEPIAETVDFD